MTTRKTTRRPGRPIQALPVHDAANTASERFRKRLGEARIRAGLSQAAAAREAEIPQSYWSEIESGTAKPGLDVAERMAKALGKTLAEMV